MFLMTRDGQADAPIDPGARWNMDPWVARPPRKLHRFTTPANPLPLVCPITSTTSPSLKMSTLISAPTSRGSLPSSRISWRARNVPFPAFWKCPSMGLSTLCALAAPKPIWTASYPSRWAVFRWITVHGPASITVTGMTFPSVSNTWVIPSFFPNIPVVMARTRFRSRSLSSYRLQLDLDFHSRRQVELHQRVDRRTGRLVDVEQPLVGPDLELLPALLVHVRGAVDREPFDLGRQGDRSRDLGAGLPRLLDDLAGRLVQQLVVEGLQPDPDLLVLNRHVDAP